MFVLCVFVVLLLCICLSFRLSCCVVISVCVVPCFHLFSTAYFTIRLAGFEFTCFLFVSSFLLLAFLCFSVVSCVCCLLCVLFVVLFVVSCCRCFSCFFYCHAFYLFLVC